MNKKVLPSIIALLCALTTSAQYTLADWKIKDFNPNSELNLNASEYKLDGNHPNDCREPNGRERCDG